MGTIVIEEYAAAGASHSRNVSVADLSKQTARTENAETSSSVASITLKRNTRVVRVFADELHRVSQVDATCASTYSIVPASTSREISGDFGVQGGEALYFRTDA